MLPLDVVAVWIREEGRERGGKWWDWRYGGVTATRQVEVKVVVLE